jgi:hypothetical protein
MAWASNDSDAADCARPAPSCSHTRLGWDLATMGDVAGGRGVVVVIRPRRRSQARCTCGWIGKGRLLPSSANVDALIHAAQHDCEPAIPLFQPGAVVPTKPPGDVNATSPRAPQLDAES